MKRKITCLLMALMLVISLLPMGAIHANAASAWSYSENVVNLIKQFEGFSASAYWDVSQWTIGYGTPGYAGQFISEAEADLVLRDRLNGINAKINQFTASRNLYLTQNQHDALVSFSFNCGTDWMTQGGRFFDAVVSGAGTDQFLFAISLWANVGTTPDANLLNRRMAEANLYLNGVYSKTAPAAYTYTIFDPNGGTPGNNGEDKMQGYLSGSNVNILVGNPTKAGYSFGGWFSAPTGGNGVKYLNASTATRTLYAQYGTPVSVTSTYSYVRNGAGTNYTQLGILNAGTQVIIVETAQVNGALWGRYSDGWISLDTTNYGNSAAPVNPGQPASGAAYTGTVVCNTGVNVRAGAGTNYQVVGSAYNGQRISIYEVVNVNGTNWGRIGTNQWISLTYVRTDSTVTPGTGSNGVIWDNGNTTTNPSTPSGSYKMAVVSTNKLNVRSAAGVGNPIVGSLSNGTSVRIYNQILKDNAPWGQIDQGWICLNYVTLVSAVDTPSAVTPGTSTPTGTVIATGTVVSNTALNVRSGAGTTAPRVSALNPGTPVSIYEKVTVNGMEWGRIGTNQWVCLAYVRLNNTTSTVVPTTPTTPTTPSGATTGVVISSTQLNVRSGAGANFARVAALNPGTVVTVYEVFTNGNQQWGRIGTNQWVCLTYVRMNGTPSSTGAPSTTPSTSGTMTGVVSSSTALNVRAAAGTNNAAIAKLNPGTVITIFETTNLNGVVWGRTSAGWVCMNYVRLTNGSTVTWQ